MERSKIRPMVSLALLFTVILISAIYPFKVHAAEPSEFIRIGLCFGNTSVSSCTLSSETGFILGSATEAGFTETLPLPAYRTLIASLDNGHVALRDPAGVLLSADIGKNGCLMPINDAGNPMISVDNNKYRGGILLTVNRSGRIDVINYLSTEEYLYGVVHLEMGQSNPLEALKAQAVAARSFAVENMGRHGASGFDLCNTTHCQVYGGNHAEYPSSTSAVDETRGLSIYWSGKPASAFYHKNSGGHTQNAGDVWSADLPHLVGKADPYTPDYPWSALIPFDSLEQKLIQAGYLCGSIKSVAVNGRSAAGAVTSLMITGSQSTITLEKEKIRSVLGASLIRSRYFNIGDTYQGRAQGVAQTVTLSITNGNQGSHAGETIFAVTATGAVTALKSAEVYLSDGNRTVQPKKVIAGGSESAADQTVATDGKLVLAGIGSGHGVGMSQDGAIEMAKQGFSFLNILNFYFTDIEVK